MPRFGPTYLRCSQSPSTRSGRQVATATIAPSLLPASSHPLGDAFSRAPYLESNKHSDISAKQPFNIADHKTSQIYYGNPEDINVICYRLECANVASRRRFHCSLDLIQRRRSRLFCIFPSSFSHFFNIIFALSESVRPNAAREESRHLARPPPIG